MMMITGIHEIHKYYTSALNLLFWKPDLQNIVTIRALRVSRRLSVEKLTDMGRHMRRFISFSASPKRALVWGWCFVRAKATSFTVLYGTVSLKTSPNILSKLELASVKLHVEGERLCVHYCRQICICHPKDSLLPECVQSFHPGRISRWVQSESTPLLSKIPFSTLPHMLPVKMLRSLWYQAGVLLTLDTTSSGIFKPFLDSYPRALTCSYYICQPFFKLGAVFNCFHSHTPSWWAQAQNVDDDIFGAK